MRRREEVLRAKITVTKGTNKNPIQTQTGPEHKQVGKSCRLEIRGRFLTASNGSNSRTCTKSRGQKVKQFSRWGTAGPRKE